MTVDELHDALLDMLNACPALKGKYRVVSTDNSLELVKADSL